MIARIPVTESNIFDWNASLKVLSVKRCIPFYAEMGLPEAIVLSPEQLLKQTQHYLRRLSTLHRDSRQTYLAAQQHQLEQFFEQVTQSYGQATATELHIWCMRYVVNFDGLMAWYDILFDFCDAENNIINNCETCIDAAIQDRICQVIKLEEHRVNILNTRQRLDEARTFAQTNWETWLNEQSQYAFGDAEEVMSIVEVALDLVELLIECRYAYETWKNLREQLYFSEFEAFLSWAYEYDLWVERATFNSMTDAS